MSGGVKMIILDETKLRKGTLSLIGEDYEMNDNDFNTRDEYIDAIVDRFYFDIDEFKERLIGIITKGLFKLELI